MRQSYFQFKQFIVHQENCAMKVCTDSCLFGAWTAIKASQQESPAKKALDIGGGTGLLSMMFAQKNNTDIDVIEINQDASQQAIQNISLSDWKDSIHVKNTSLQLFSPVQQYDFIFSNPPFFENDLKSADEFKNSAKHDTELSLDFLVHFIAEHIATNGKATVLLPFHRTSAFEQMIIENGMFVNEKLLVKQSVKHDYFRSMLLFSKIKQSKAVETEISIRDDQNEYTLEFKDLLRDYYLAF